MSVQRLVRHDNLVIPQAKGPNSELPQELKREELNLDSYDSRNINKQILLDLLCNEEIQTSELLGKYEAMIYYGLCDETRFRELTAELRADERNKQTEISETMSLDSIEYARLVADPHLRSKTLINSSYKAREQRFYFLTNLDSKIEDLMFKNETASGRSISPEEKIDILYAFLLAARSSLREELDLKDSQGRAEKPSMSKARFDAWQLM